MSSVATETLAAIDIGTNTVLLTVARADAAGIAAVLERATITRLGRGVDQNRRLEPAAVEATLECLRDYAAVMREHGVQRFGVVATSAARDAVDGDRFLDRAEGALGQRPQIIEGEHEARLTASGALMGLALGGPGVTVVDIGGGSTEFVMAELGPAGASVSRAWSLDIGSVRLTERCLRGDPPSAREIGEMRGIAARAIATLPPPVSGAALVGVAGTVTTLAAIALGSDPYEPTRVHGSVLTAAQVEELCTRLSRMTAAERLGVRGLEAKRADVIVAGALIVRAALEWSCAPRLIVSDRGVRWGLLAELARVC